MVVLKELILNSFYFQRVWWSWKNWFWTVSTFRGCGGLERTDFATVSTLRGCGGLERTNFEQFLLSEGVVVLKGLILNSFYFGRVWWCCGLERTDSEQFLLWDGVVVGCGHVVVLKELILNQFLLWEGVVVMKELILNSFYFGRVWW